MANSIRKIRRHRTGSSKLATKFQSRMKQSTFRAVNKHRIKHTGHKINHGNKLLTSKKAQFKPQSTDKRLPKLGNYSKDKRNSFGRGKIIARPVKKTSFKKNRIVRIMGHGQFTISNKVLKKLSKVDNAMVQMVSYERPNDDEFRKHLAQLTDIVRKFGKACDSKEMVRSDIILPSVDLSIDEAKKLFKGEGVIPIT